MALEGVTFIAILGLILPGPCLVNSRKKRNKRKAKGSSSDESSSSDEDDDDARLKLLRESVTEVKLTQWADYPKKNDKGIIM